MNVTEELADWEDSRNMDRKRQWFTIDEALEQLALHKPVQRRYLQQLKNSRNNMTTTTTTSHTTETMTALNLPHQIPESSSSSLLLTETQTTDSNTVNLEAADTTVAPASIANNITAANALAEQLSTNNSLATATTIQPPAGQTATAI